MVTSTLGGLIPIIKVLAVPAQLFKVGITWIVPADLTVVAIEYTSVPDAVYPEIVGELVPLLILQVLGTVQAKLAPEIVVIE